MTYRVDIRDECWDRMDEHWEYLRRHHGSEIASRWYDAALREATFLAHNPGGRPLCLDPAVHGRGLREAYFGAGRRDTHRVIFRVVERPRGGGVVEALTVCAFGRDDLTAGDLAADDASGAAGG